MSENVQLALIISTAFVVVCGIAIFVLKDKLREGEVEVSKERIKGRVQTHEPVNPPVKPPIKPPIKPPVKPPVTSVSGNKIIGDGNKLTARNGGQIKRNKIKGNKTKIDSEND